jgi:hypothetical protein
MAQGHNCRHRRTRVNCLYDAHRDERTILAIFAFVTVRAARHACGHRHVHHAAQMWLRRCRRRNQRCYGQTNGHEGRESEIEVSPKIHPLVSHGTGNFERPPTSHVRQSRWAATAPDPGRLVRFVPAVSGVDRAGCSLMLNLLPERSNFVEGDSGHPREPRPDASIPREYNKCHLHRTRNAQNAERSALHRNS